MNKTILSSIILIMPLCIFGQNWAGTWRVSPEAGALHVGPGDGSTWWASSLDDVTTRECYFDDEYVFNADGSFSNVLGTETWIEAWQGIAADGCGSPVSPHDGSSAATYTYTDSTITLSGVGAYLGLPKVYNGGELGAANADSAIASRTYDIALSSGNDTMTVSISIGSGIWTYKLVAAQPSTGVISDIVPTEFSLANNYPNPFNPTTTISFSIPKQMDVGLNIYNVMGQLVANVAKGRLDAGTHNVQWNGRDHNGNVLPSGLYFYELVGGKQFRKVKKMTLVK